MERKKTLDDELYDVLTVNDLINIFKIPNMDQSTDLSTDKLYSTVNINIYSQMGKKDRTGQWKIFVGHVGTPKMKITKKT